MKVFTITDSYDVGKIASHLHLEFGADGSIHKFDKDVWKINNIYNPNTLEYLVPKRNFGYQCHVNRAATCCVDSGAYEPYGSYIGIYLLSSDIPEFIIRPIKPSVYSYDNYVIIESFYDHIPSSEILSWILQTNIKSYTKSIEEICKEGRDSILNLVMCGDSIGCDEVLRNANFKAIKNELQFHHDLYKRDNNYSYDDIVEIKQKRLNDIGEDSFIWRYLRNSGLIEHFEDREWHLNGPTTREGDYVLDYINNHFVEIEGSLLLKEN